MTPKSSVREVLVAHLLDDVGRRQEHRHGDVITGPSEGQLVEIGQRDDRPAIGVVQRGRQLAAVDGDGRRSGAREGGDDVDALPGAREKDRRHDVRA